MSVLVEGLHHVTALFPCAQHEHDFLSRALGLRRVKSTVNFDQPRFLNLIYGNRTGDAGTLVTTIPLCWEKRGRPGADDIVEVGFTISTGSLDAWYDKLRAYGVNGMVRAQRFAAPCLVVRGMKGERIALYEAGKTPCTLGAVTGLHGVTLSCSQPDEGRRLLALLGFDFVASDKGRSRFALPGAQRGGIIDIVQGPAGRVAQHGVGTVHHIAFCVADLDALKRTAQALRRAGYSVLSPTSRGYFDSIYFRGPGGKLYEVATRATRFDIDEPQETMGQRLIVPDHLALHLPDLRESFARLGG